jgi:spore coat protein U-like protein
MMVKRLLKFRAVFFMLCVCLMVCAQVRASASCSLISGGTLNFGNYDPFSTRDTESTTSLTIRCIGTGRVSYQIQLSTGSSGNYSARAMTLQNSVGNQLLYNLYTKSKRRKVWGDGTLGTKVIKKSKKNNFSKTHRVYGQIPALQTTVRAGNYSDTIIATLLY